MITFTNGANRYFGLSSDSKPSNDYVNSLFQELDTGDLYFFNGTAWGKVGGNSGVEVEELDVTENGTYTAPSGKAYSPVVVNVASGGGEPQYYTATFDDTEPMMNGVGYVLPSDADVTKIYAVGDGGGEYSSYNAYYVSVGLGTYQDAPCLVGNWCDDMGMQSDVMLLMKWVAAEHTFRTDPKSFSSSPTFPATIKLYHT